MQKVFAFGGFGIFENLATAAVNECSAVVARWTVCGQATIPVRYGFCCAFGSGPIWGLEYSFGGLKGKVDGFHVHEFGSSVLEI
ncbi:hypothetical protein OROMI_004131 [Orobanche minor]